jgi:hypothetical protein
MNVSNLSQVYKNIVFVGIELLERRITYMAVYKCYVPLSGVPARGLLTRIARFGQIEW